MFKLKERLGQFVSAVNSFSISWEPSFELEPLKFPTPIWDNGIDYKIPAYIRRKNLQRSHHRQRQARYFYRARGWRVTTIHGHASAVNSSRFLIQEQH